MAQLLEEEGEEEEEKEEEEEEGVRFAWNKPGRGLIQAKR